MSRVINRIKGLVEKPQKPCCECEHYIQITSWHMYCGRVAAWFRSDSNDPYMPCSDERSFLGSCGPKGWFWGDKKSKDREFRCETCHAYFKGSSHVLTIGDRYSLSGCISVDDHKRELMACENCGRKCGIVMKDAPRIVPV